MMWRLLMQDRRMQRTALRPGGIRPGTLPQAPSEYMPGDSYGVQAMEQKPPAETMQSYMPNPGDPEQPVMPRTALEKIEAWGMPGRLR